MSVYQGGKKRIGKRIYKAISALEEELSPPGGELSYFEPFCGMCGVLRHFAREGRSVKACDANKDLILLLKEVQKNGVRNLPKKCSEKEWEKYKSKESSAKRGFIGISASWGGIFFQGYRLDYTSKRDYLKEARNGLEKLGKDIEGFARGSKDVAFLSSRSYDRFSPKNKLVYCDPPYKGNQLGGEKGFFKSFDHVRFWEKMRAWSKNNIVVISESTAPRDFKKIWTTESFVNNSDRYKTKKYPDNLYIHESLYKKLSAKAKREIKKA